jgi:hypothetical protein
MAVVVTYRKMNVVGKYRQQLIRVDYAAGDTALTVATGFSKIHAYSVSPTSVTAVPLDFATVSGGTISITANNPGAACYIFLDVIGN